MILRIIVVSGLSEGNKNQDLTESKINIFSCGSDPKKGSDGFTSLDLEAFDTSCLIKVSLVHRISRDNRKILEKHGYSGYKPVLVVFRAESKVEKIQREYDD